ncbi:MAG: MGH1-like glycoside hydrolase domain-containing protein [Terriglobia bacterium]
MTRRGFATGIGALGPALWDLLRKRGSAAQASVKDSGPPEGKKDSGFPKGLYTPFGYLDNPYHSWALHQSGVIRSVPAIGLGLYYPAGPGGYFDYQRNSGYRVLLRIGFRISGHVLLDPSDFQAAGIQVAATHHSKNILTYAFAVPPLKAVIRFCQAGENTLMAMGLLENTEATEQDLELFVIGKLELGDAVWWGRDGTTGHYAPRHDAVLMRSFAAGPAFTIRSDRASSGHWVTNDESALTEWMRQPNRSAQSAFTYFPKPLIASLRFPLLVPTKQGADFTLVLSRAQNEAAAHQESGRALRRAAPLYKQKESEDDRFWSRAPKLEGDFPPHWRHGWVYDFETLRMMVRQPLGAYHHAWDAMQIQAPRNALAETSIDMWALSYADQLSAQEALLGQFQDALEPNVPCMREDGTKNMVTVDGSECGTALQWCYPFYCLESVFLRTLDRSWLAKLYPYLAAYLEWTLRHRRDGEGWIVAKCSWETGMDASRRFLIQQPTGGELIDFVRVAELQAAMSHAAGAMARFASALGRTGEMRRWHTLCAAYREKTQQLWRDGWFYDFDTRSGEFIIIPGHREVTQVGPIMCGTATDQQIQVMIPKMREYESHPEFWLEWPSHVLPYAESVWRAGDREFLSRVLFEIADRIYASMDRRQVEPEKKLGWPGVSCEVWGIQGARGGEGYGWGATMPAHIIRSIFGFRELEDIGRQRFILAPNLPDTFLTKGKSFSLRNVHYRGRTLDLHYEPTGQGNLHVELHLVEGSMPTTLKARDEGGSPVAMSGAAGRWSFDAKNHALYSLKFAE